MTINDAVTEIESLLATMKGVCSSQVRPSGDDVDVIKVWVDLGEATLDRTAWTMNLESEIRKLVPGAAAYRLQIRVESGE